MPLKNRPTTNIRAQTARRIGLLKLFFVVAGLILVAELITGASFTHGLMVALFGGVGSVVGGRWLMQCGDDLSGVEQCSEEHGVWTGFRITRSSSDTCEGNPEEGSEVTPVPSNPDTGGQVPGWDPSPVPGSLAEGIPIPNALAAFLAKVGGAYVSALGQEMLGAAGMPGRGGCFLSFHTFKLPLVGDTGVPDGAHSAGCSR